MNAHSFLVALTIVLGVAAFTTVLFHRLRQPVVLGYILAGFIIGPSVPVPLVADRAIVQTLSELGVILLMFSLGLEFSLRKLMKVGPQAAVTALLQSSLMFWLGFLVGRLFGWSTVECLFTGAIIATSSTTIIAKVFDEQKIRGPLRELVVGVLIVEDLIAIVLMAALTAVATGAGLSARTMASTIGKLSAFLVGLVAVGLLLVPRSVRAVRRLGSKETTLVASIGFCFAVSLLAHELGYSVALGAFISGSLIAESGEAEEIEHLVKPVRDVFAAIFFVSVGILLDPALVVQHWSAVATLTAVVIAGKAVSVALGAFLSGVGIRPSVQAGMSLGQIGEFSFIIAGLGLSLGATGDFLYPVAVTVSALTTLTTPWLVKVSGPLATAFDRALPRPLQTFVTLYASWIEQLHSRSGDVSRGAVVRRLVRLLVLDTALLVALAVGTSIGLPSLVALVHDRFGIGKGVARTVLLGAALVVAFPLGAGVVRVSQRLGLAVAESALPSAEGGRVDLAATPRRALVVTLQLAIVLLTGLPVLAITQPVIGGVVAPLLFVALLAVLAVKLWRGATELHGHVHAGAQAVVEALLARARPTSADATSNGRDDDAALAEVRAVLPGLGDPTPFRLGEDCRAVGMSLARLNLRSATGATVLAIRRGEEALVVPTAEEVLRAGDVLALAGSHEAVELAKDLLRTSRRPEAARDAVDALRRDVE